MKISCMISRENVLMPSGITCESMKSTEAWQSLAKYLVSWRNASGFYLLSYVSSRLISYELSEWFRSQPEKEIYDMTRFHVVEHNRPIRRSIVLETFKTKWHVSMFIIAEALHRLSKADCWNDRVYHGRKLKRNSFTYLPRHILHINKQNKRFKCEKTQRKYSF